MKKIDQILIKVFIWGAPLVLVVAIIGSVFGPDNLRKNYQLINDISGLIFGFWFIAAFYFAIRILVSSEFRERILLKIAKFKEQDEREEKISASSLRTTFLANMAILIFVLILSTLNVSAYRVPESQAVNGKRGTISLGFNFSFIEETSKQKNADDREYMFNYAGLPIKVQGIVLLLLLWNLGSYQYSVRRLSRD